MVCEMFCVSVALPDWDLKRPLSVNLPWFILSTVSLLFLTFDRALLRLVSTPSLRDMHSRTHYISSISPLIQFPTCLKGFLTVEALSTSFYLRSTLVSPERSCTTWGSEAFAFFALVSSYLCRKS
jgi:hypothetical protein